MAVEKYYVVKNCDTIKLVYQISVKLDIGNENTCLDMFLDDVIEYTVETKEVLNKISEILRILNSMGYVMNEEGSIVRQSIKKDPNCAPY